MSNRFRNLINVRSNFTPKEFTPDFGAYAKVLGEQQGLYDQLGKLRDAVPQHLQVDRKDVNDYMSEVSDKINSISQVYSQSGINQGNRDRKRLMESIRRDWQPGGKAHSFQQNYKSFQDYRKSIDELHKKGDINSSKRDALLNKSTKDFGKSFQDGVFNEFNGITAARDVDMAAQADKLAKGWMSNKVKSGQYKMMNGQYYDIRTKEYVDPKEIYKEVYTQLSNDPTNKAFIEQEALLTGQDQKAVSDQLLSEASKFAANKYGFVKEDSKYLKNWAMQENMRHRNKKKEIDYQKALEAGTEETVLYTVNSGLKPLNLSGAYIGEEKDVIAGTGPGGYGKVKKTVYKEQPLEDYAKSEKGQKEYPGLSDMIDMPQFRRKRTGNDIESNKEYNTRIQKAWEQKRVALSAAAGNYRQFNDQQKSRAKASLFGTKDSPGDIVHKSIWLTAPGKEPKAVTYQQLLKMTGNKEITELNKKANVLGTVESDNGIVPSGYQTVIGSKDGKDIYHAIISNTSIQEAKYNQPIFELFKPQHDGSMKESQPVIWSPANDPNNAMILRSKATDIYNGENFVGRKIQIFELDIDEDGNIVGETLSDVKPEELKEAHNKLNVYKPSNLNKRLENE